MMKTIHHLKLVEEAHNVREEIDRITNGHVAHLTVTLTNIVRELQRQLKNKEKNNETN